MIDNEFGRIYEDSFRAWAEANPEFASEFVAVTHEPTARLVAAEMEQLARAEPDVFLSMTAVEPCISAVTEANRSGLTDSAVGLFTPSGCRQAGGFLDAAGEAGHGFWIVAGAMKSLEDPAFADETFVAFTNARLRAGGAATTPTRPHGMCKAPRWTWMAVRRTACSWTLSATSRVGPVVLLSMAAGLGVIAKHGCISRRKSAGSATVQDDPAGDGHRGDRAPHR